MYNMKICLVSFILLLLACRLFPENLSYYSIPGADWALEVDTGRFLRDKSVINDAVNMRSIEFLSPDEKSQLVIILEMNGAVESERSASLFVKELKSRYKKNITIKTDEYNGVPVVWYTPGENIAEFHLAVFINKADYRITLFLSGGLDEAHFRVTGERIVTSLAVVEKYTPVFEENFEFGKFYYHKQDFFKSLEYFSTLLADNGISGKMSEKEYIELITMSSAAYSITGSNDIAVSVLRKGLSVFSEEPLFYYNLAAMGAIYGDSELVFENIELAFFYAVKKGHLYELPDPLDDPQFQIFTADLANREHISNIILNAKSLM